MYVTITGYAEVSWDYQGLAGSACCDVVTASRGSFWQQETQEVPLSSIGRSELRSWEAKLSRLKKHGS